MGPQSLRLTPIPHSRPSEETYYQHRGELRKDTCKQAEHRGNWVRMPNGEFIDINDMEDDDEMDC